MFLQQALDAPPFKLTEAEFQAPRQLAPHNQFERGRVNKKLL